MDNETQAEQKPTKIGPFRPSGWTSVIGLVDSVLAWFSAWQWIAGSIAISIITMVCAMVLSAQHTRALAADWQKWKIAIGELPVLQFIQGTAVAAVMVEELQKVDHLLLDAGIDSCGAEGVHKLINLLHEYEERVSS